VSERKVPHVALGVGVTVGYFVAASTNFEQPILPNAIMYGAAVILGGFAYNWLCRKLWGTPPVAPRPPESERPQP
jgi:hypothetical protein